MLSKLFFAFLPLALLIAIPVVLRPEPEAKVVSDLKLVIITPHNESIRHEFENGFNTYYAEKYDRTVTFDWRAPGGTSDIVRYLDDQYMTRFRRVWEETHGPGSWTDEVAKAFNNRKLDLNDPGTTDRQRQAREAFLASEVGIGIDLFFGGGQYEMKIQAEKGHAVDAGLLEKHPEWFSPDVIPATYSGETFYDPEGRYYGACLSAFGIIYNKDRVAMLADDQPPTRWSHLGEPRFFGEIAVADPTKSGSITKCFEMLIQQAMAEAVEAHGEVNDKALAEGWANGLNLIKRIGGNSRYVTDSASKVPHDVGKGDTTAGMCIDFYGRSEAQWTAYQSGGRERITYVTPEGGSSLSVDPILMFRGAPNRELAIEFMEFVLSPAGQKLWNYRVGTPGGPEKYALRRLPVRRDMYTPEHQQQMADAGKDPFEEARGFEYHGGWTGPYFGLIRNLIKAMALDAAPELRAAWEAIDKAGGPEAVPEAMAAFNELPFTYEEAGEARSRLNANTDEEVLDSLQAMREWGNFFRERYQRAMVLAQAGR